MEVLLGMQPLSNYDASALPLYAAFRATPNLAPFVAISPKVSLTTRNSKVAYRAALAARLDFSRPDAVSPGIMTDMLEHAGYKAAATR